jgi:large repetitive protein
MKKLNSHKNPILLGVGILAVITTFLFTTCDIGLGQIVNTEKPIISNGDDGNGPGSFLQGGSNLIELEVENKLGFKIDEVFMEVEYTDKNTKEVVRKKIPAKQNSETGKWEVDLDVSEMEDGQIKAWVTAIDESGNETTSTEITYFVKNKLPQVKLTLPSVSDEDFDDPEFLKGLIETDQIYIGLDLMGLATDDYGIMDGWPKIKFWPASYIDELDIDEIPVDNKWGQWRTVELPMNYKPGSTVAKFTYPFARLIEDASKPENDPARWRLPKRKENGKYDGNEYISLDVHAKYRFQIWVKDGFGNDNYYPNRTDNKYGTDPDTAELKYIEVYHQATGDRPIIQVPDMMRYYNKVNNFTVNISVLSSDPNFRDGQLGTPVEVWINKTSESTAKEMGPFYPTTSTASTPYNYVLSVSPTDPRWGTLEGTRYINVTAKDSNDQESGVFVQYFILDFNPPTVDFEQPSVLTNIHAQGKLDSGKFVILYPPNNSRPKWVTGEVTAGGKSTDTNGISEILFHVGKLGDDSISLTEEQRKAIYQNNSIWEKTGLGSMTPHPKWSGSLYAWTYKDTYPIGYKTVPGYSAVVQEFDEIKNTYSFNPDTSAVNNPYQTLGTEHNKERFYLPLYLKVVDVAGNIQIVHYKLSIDPLLDEPSIDFTYPKAGDTVGGTVRLSGIATDNIWMNTVLMRIHKAGVTGSDTSNAYYYKPSTETWFYDTNPGFLPKPTNTAGWFKTTLYGEGAVVNWTAQVNGDGGLNPENGAETVNVDIEVIGIDSDVANGNPHIVGPIEKQTIKFSSKVPTITDVKITKGTSIRDYNEGISTSGKFDISMKISALKNTNTGTAINKVSVKVNSDPQVIVMTADTANTSLPDYNTVWKITNPVNDPLNSERKAATLTITVDSTIDGIIKGLGYGKTGVMNLEITVEDATAQNFSSTYNYRIGIDNFFPKGTIETSVMAHDDPINGKYFLVEGTATDSPGASSVSIQGIERVLVYFEKATITYPGGVRTVTGNNTMLNPNGGTISSGAGTYFQSYVVMDTARAGWNSTMTIPNAQTGFVIPTFTYDSTKKCYTSLSAMVIDYSEGDRTKDFDEDGTYGETWMGLTDKTWQARMLISNVAGTTQQFTDGPYMVHYIIMDTAGNATHYQKDIYVENNKPFINSINIGTDIDFNGSITNWTSENNPGEYRNNAVGLTSDSELLNRITTADDVFRIRNKNFGIRMNITKGNGNKKATVTYVTRGAAIPVANMVRGSVYQIAETKQNTDFTKLGSPNNYTNTVFVAAGKGEGDATVYPFTTVAQQTAIDVSTGINYVYFTNFTASVTDTTAGLFIIKVYDTTIPSGAEADQLAHAVLYTVSVNNSDTIDPKIDVANFGQKYLAAVSDNPQDYDKNVLTNLSDAIYSDYVVTTAGVKQGYVQYQSDSGGSKAYISGKVTFHGKVNDNHRIDRITVQIGTPTTPNYESGAEFNIAIRNSSTGLLQAAPQNIAERRDFAIVSAVPQFSIAYGHTLTWKFTWDSSLISTKAATNVNITFRVYDMATPARSTSVVKNVDIVPYISEIQTPLSDAFSSNPSVFNRSALGGYPVREGDSIIIKGFNLGDAVSNAVINGTASVALSGGTNNGSAITSTVPATATSGPLVVTVNSIPSFNNSANKTKTAAYNNEPNNVNNNILDNSRYIYVWTTGDLFNNGTFSIGSTNTTIDMKDVSYPFMRIDNNGNRLISHGFYPGAQNGRLRVLKNNLIIDLGTAATNRMVYTTLGTNGNSDNTPFYAAGTDLSSNVDYNRGFQLGLSNAAGTNSINRSGTATTGPGNYIDQGDIRIYATNASAHDDRFKVPRIAVMPANKAANQNRSDTNKDKILLSYYDSDAGRVEAIYGEVGATTGIPTTSATNNRNEYNGIKSLVSSSGSEYTATGFSSDGTPLVAWYDSSNERLMFAYATMSGTNISGWNSAQIDSKKGTYVDMAVDGGGNVHLAYYSNSGGLWYTYIPSGSVKTNSRTVTPVRVDTYLSAGTRLMINVRQETSPTTRYVPYITYAHASFPGTKQSVRIAWLTSAAANTSNGTETDNTFTGNWEVMTVPINRIPNNTDYICNGVPSVATWNTAGTSLSYNINLNQTIVVGYMTSTAYEGAILKGDIRDIPSILKK